MQINDTIIELVVDLSRLLKTGMSYDSGSKHLTLHQLQTLTFIAKQQQVRMVEVAKYFNITKPTTTVLINSLVKNGYLRRESGKKDKREVKVALAKKGEKFINQAKKHRSTKINHILSYTSDEDKKLLKGILQTIVENLKEENKNEK